MANEASPNTPTDLVPQSVAATLLNFSERTLEHWRLNGTGPAELEFYRIGPRAVRYSLSNIEVVKAAALRRATASRPTAAAAYAGASQEDRTAA